MNRFVGLLVLAGCAFAKPASVADYLSIEDDIAKIDSSIRREVRAPLPVGFATEVADLLSAGTEVRRSRIAREDQHPGNRGSSSSRDAEPHAAGTIVEEHYSHVPVESEDEGYSEGEHYSEGSTSGADGDYHGEAGDSEHYSDAGEGGHYTSGGEGSLASYSIGSGDGDHYSTGSGIEGSHGVDTGDHHFYDSGSDGDHY